MKHDIFKDQGGEWRYRILGDNGEKMATSEGYTRKADARRGFHDLQRNMLSDMVELLKRARPFVEIVGGEPDVVISVEAQERAAQLMADLDKQGIEGAPDGQ